MNKNKLKYIAFVLPDLNGGGAQKMIVNLANEFVIKGYRVDLVLFNRSGEYLNLVHDDIRIVNFNKSRALWSIIPLACYIKNNKPDIVVSALFHVNLVTLIAKLFSVSRETKIIISERNNLTLRVSDFNKIKSFTIKLFVKLFYPLADQIIGISNGVCDDLKNILKPLCHDKIKTIYNPVVTNNCEDKIKEEVTSPFPENCGLKLITSGRLVVQKDYPTLLKAFALYLEKYGDAYLVVLGDGELKSNLLNLSNQLNINNNIKFLGFVDNPLAYMKQADMFVISSAWEGFCNVIVEALYAGLKIVSTDCKSGPSEILMDEQYGALSPVGNVESLALNIQRVSRQEIDKNTQKKRALEFTVENKVLEFESLWNSL